MFGFNLKKVFSIGLLCAISPLAFSANWEYVTVTRDFTAYIDTNSIKNYTDVYSRDNTGFRSAWFKYVYHTPKKLFDGKSYSEFRFKSITACQLDKATIESVVGYDKRGNIVYSNKQRVATVSANDWGSIVPDTIVEDMFNRVCKQ